MQKLSGADILNIAYLLEILRGHSKVTSSGKGGRGTLN